MENSTYTEDELNKLSKEAIVFLCLQQSQNFQLLSEQNKLIQKQNEQLIKQIEDLKEQIAILTQHRFGKKTEKSKLVSGQLAFDPETGKIFNEAELLVDTGIPAEPVIEEVIVRKKRSKASFGTQYSDTGTGCGCI